MAEEDSLYIKLQKDFKEELKSGNEVAISTIRLMKSAISEREIAMRTQDKVEGITDTEIKILLSKMRKQRIESAKTFEDAGRIDIATRELEEIKIIENYLPEQITGDALLNIIQDVIKEEEAKSIKDMGKCIKSLREKYPDSIDFSEAGNLLRKKLSN